MHFAYAQYFSEKILSVKLRGTYYSFQEKNITF